MGNPKGNFIAKDYERPDDPEGLWWRLDGTDKVLLYGPSPVGSVSINTGTWRKKTPWCSHVHVDRVGSRKHGTEAEGIAWVESFCERYLEWLEWLRLNPPPRTDCHTHSVRHGPPRDASGNEG